MIRIVYDHQIFVAQRYGGISRYFAELASRIGSTNGFQATIAAPLYVNRYLNRDGLRVVGVRMPPVPRTGRLMEAASASAAGLICRIARPDIIHETYYRTESIAAKGIPCVVTVYDMVDEKLRAGSPGISDLLERKRRAVARADLIICISEATNRDLIEILGVPPAKTVTVHLGVAPRPPVMPAAIRCSDERPFLLFVGDRDGYKNFKAFLSAYAASRELVRDARIVAFGGGPFGPREVEHMRSLRLAPTRDVAHVAGDDDLLNSHYASALALVYPSLYEGFGLPTLEAMRIGCPVACSSTAALPEVVGDAAALFDPSDVESLRSAMERVAGSTSLRASLVERGFARAAHFSWDRCAQRTGELYQGLAGRAQPR